MESQPQNPEFRINTENFHPCHLFVCIEALRPSQQFFSHFLYSWVEPKLSRG